MADMLYEDIYRRQDIAEKGVADGYASLSNLAKVVEDPANATATPTANKIPIADGSGKLDAWVSQAFPVGSVFLAVVSTDPATLLGYGTWSAFGAGRVLVGLDSGDTDFDAAGEPGGAKTGASAGTVAAIGGTGDAQVNRAAGATATASQTHGHSAPAF